MVAVVGAIKLSPAAVRFLKTGRAVLAWLVLADDVIAHVSFLPRDRRASSLNVSPQSKIDRVLGLMWPTRAASCACSAPAVPGSRPLLCRSFTSPTRGLSGLEKEEPGDRGEGGVVDGSRSRMPSSPPCTSSGDPKPGFPAPPRVSAVIAQNHRLSGGVPFLPREIVLYSHDYAMHLFKRARHARLK